MAESGYTRCAHSVYGCQFSGTDEDVADHAQDCVFERFKTYIERNERRIEAIEDRLRQREEEVALLRKKVSELTKMIEGGSLSPRVAPKAERKPAIPAPAAAKPAVPAAPTGIPALSGASQRPTFMLNLDAVAQQREKDQAVPSSAVRKSSPGRASSPRTNAKASRFSPGKARAARVAAGLSATTSYRVEADGGITYKPLRGAVYAPTNFKASPSHSKEPVDTLQLEFVYGYRGHDCRMNTMYCTSGELVYFAAGVGVVYNTQSHTQRFFTGHTDDILSIAMHPDGDVFATGQLGKDPMIYIWRASNCEPLKCLQHYHERGVSALAFSPDGKYLVSVGMDNYNTIMVWDWEKGLRVSCERGGSDRLFMVGFTPASNTFASVGVKHMRYWTIATDGSLSYKKGIMGAKGTLQPIFCVSGDSEGRFLTGTQNGEVYAWRASAVSDVYKSHDGAVFAIYTDEQGVITGGKDGVLRLWDRSLNTVEHEFPLPQTPGNDNVIRSLHRRGNMIAIGTRSNQLLEFNQETQQFRVLIEGHTAEVWGLATHPNSNLFVTAGTDKTLRMWDVAARKPVWLYELEGEALCAAFHPNMPLVAVGMKEGRVAVVDYDKKTAVVSKADRKDRITDVKFSPNGAYLAVGSADTYVDVYNVEADFALMATCKGHSSAISHLDWSANSGMIQTNSTGYEMLYWDAKSGKGITFHAPARDEEWETWTCVLGWPVIGIWPKGADGTDINAADRSHDGNLLVTADDMGQVHLMRYPCFNRMSVSRDYTGHSSHVTNARFTHNDSYVITTGGQDTCVLQWKRNATGPAMVAFASMGAPTTAPALPATIASPRAVRPRDVSATRSTADAGAPSQTGQIMSPRDGAAFAARDKDEVARLKAEQAAKIDAAARAKAEEVKAKADAAAKAKADAAAKAKADAAAKAEAKAKAEADAEAKARAEAGAKAEAKAKAEADARAKAAKAESDKAAAAKAKAEAEAIAQAKIEADMAAARAKADAEDAERERADRLRRQQEQEAQARAAEERRQAEAQAAADAERARQEAEADAQAQQEAEQRARDAEEAERKAVMNFFAQQSSQPSTEAMDTPTRFAQENSISSDTTTDAAVVAADDDEYADAEF
eukprot:TRINITY_DN3177_c0_g1_i1.p1 TRINITY_DN3177_c0_g1~~TRINITY_DN3177_c0_g1_i1.p1  ORF type:complete len:1137 (-),score=303.33 TRINITY_DN3177_c0_g1_i1:786-4136(-)